MTKLVDIQGLDKARVLKALYDHSGLLAPIAVCMGEARYQNISLGQCLAILKSRQSNLYFDYLMGRLIKTDIGPPHIDLSLYDRDHYEGAGEMAILDEFTSPEES